MTTRLTRTRTRRPAVRSSIDIWSVQSDDSPSQPPHITFPTITSTQRPSSHPNSPAAFNPDHYSSPKSSPSVKDNNAPFSPDNPKLVWRDSSKKATPAARRKEAEREVLVRQATAVTLILVALIFITLFVLSRTGSSSSHLSPVKQVIQSQRAVELPARQSALRKVRLLGDNAIGIEHGAQRADFLGSCRHSGGSLSPHFGTISRPLCAM